MNPFVPGILIANRFSFGVKFASIGALFLVGLIYSGVQILISTNDAIDKLSREQLGIEVQNALEPLLYASQMEQRDLSGVWRNFLNKAQELDLQIDSQRRRVLEDAISNKLYSTDPETWFGLILSVDKQVLANSGLKFNADKNTHFLIEIAYLQHPELVELYELLAQNAFNVLERARFTPDTFLALSKYRTGLWVAIQNTQLNVDILQREGHSSAGQLNAVLKDLLKLVDIVKNDILDPDSIEISQLEFERLASTVESSLSNMRNNTVSVIEQSNNERLSEQQAYQMFSLTLFLCLGLLSLYALACIAFSIRTNADRINQYSMRVANADLSRDLEVNVSDSLGEIGAHMNDTVNDLNNKVKEVFHSNEQISQASLSVADSVKVSLQQVEHQQEQTYLVASATEEMAATVTEVARNAEAASQATHSANEATQSGKDFVFKTIDSIEGLAQEVNRAADSINELQTEVEGISGVLDVIKNIADQTNLLALNAAIEAARAGEQGRGFAVVADEVRSLAKKTQDSTEEINNMIVRLQEGADSSVKVMEGSQVQAKKSVDMIAKAGDMFESISSAIGKITDQNTQVASAADEQSYVAQEISQNTNNLKSATEQITECIRHIVMANENLVSETRSLDSTVRVFKLKD